MPKAAHCQGASHTHHHRIGQSTFELITRYCHQYIIPNYARQSNHLKSGNIISLNPRRSQPPTSMEAGDSAREIKLLPLGKLLNNK